MILLHEPESPTMAKRHRTSANDAALVCDDYEDDLIWLLSQLEHKRQALETHRAKARWIPMLEQAAQVVDLVVAFAEQNCAFSAGRDIDEATSKVREYRNCQAAIQKRLLVGIDDEPLNLDAALQSQMKRCFGAIHDAIVAYFTVFTGRFSTSRASLGWVEAAASFIVEFRKTVREVSLNG